MEESKELKELKESTVEKFAPNFILAAVSVCLVDLRSKLDRPKGDILYAINKNQTALLRNEKEVDEARIELLKNAAELTDNGDVKLAKQGFKGVDGNEMETAVFTDDEHESNFHKEYQELMSTDNPDFKFFKIPLSRWNDVEIKEGVGEIVNERFLFKYIIDEDK